MPRLQTTKKLKRKVKAELPYWPSQEFMDKSCELLRKKGLVGEDEELRPLILQAYWKKREDLLAKNS